MNRIMHWLTARLAAAVLAWRQAALNREQRRNLARFQRRLRSGWLPAVGGAAKNQSYFEGRKLSLLPTDPALGVAASGDPVIVGQLPGVALTKADAVTGLTSIDTKGVFTLTCRGVTTAAGASAIAVGDIIYYVPGNTPKLSKAVGDAGAVRFGYALGTLAASTNGPVLVKIGY